MLAYSHQVFGITWGLITLTTLNLFGIDFKDPIDMLLFFGLVLFGSLFPDIDTPNSKLGRYFWALLLIIVAAVITTAVYFPSLLNLIYVDLKNFSLLLLPFLLIFTGHRKFSHSLLFLLLLCFYCYLINFYLKVSLVYLIAYIVGVVSHLIGDYLTKRGIPLFFPLSKKYFKFFITFRTGSYNERLIIWILLILNILFISSNFIKYIAL
ncbi:MULTISPECIES: metal-dependent hydrolase [Metabacillus]|uniref:metal-dependent hydrolase n=1 Tax=Metabacillus TaxID=2675233 RepID=UPI000C7FCD9D|nr:metal-dependent hydrolase [Metabacillus schmidteae]PMC34983.1 metal-dependent hydrolase [Bacillus sp. UMB0899]